VPALVLGEWESGESRGVLGVLGVLGVMGVRSAGHKIRDGGDFCDHDIPATDSLAASSTVQYGGQPQQTSSISVPPDCFLQSLSPPSLKWMLDAGAWKQYCGPRIALNHFPLHFLLHFPLPRCAAGCPTVLCDVSFPPAKCRYCGCEWVWVWVWVVTVTRLQGR
jgi:hypothetical protein